jgi:predicted GIY-YIG superfamily endonuclease
MGEKTDVQMTGFVPVKGEPLCGAYELRHTASGKVYYGSTGDIERRRREHLNSLRRGDHHNHALQGLVNENPEIELVFHRTDSIESARAIEQGHIGSEAGLNVAIDAVTSVNGLMAIPDVVKRHSEKLIGNTNAKGSKHSEEWKAKKSESMKGNTNLLGHRHSEETRRQYSEVRKGRVNDPDHVARSAEGRTRERVVIDGETYQNAAAAGKAVGMTAGGVKKRCRSDKFPNWSLVPK